MITCTICTTTTTTTKTLCSGVLDITLFDGCLLHFKKRGFRIASPEVCALLIVSEPTSSTSEMMYGLIIGLINRCGSVFIQHSMHTYEIVLKIQCCRDTHDCQRR